MRRHRSQQCSSEQRRSRHGFTLIEVMMAIGVMTVGTVGIMAMQVASTRGNIEARQMSTAVEVNRVWIERLKRDALMWQNPADRSGTQYLTVDLPAAWFTPDVNGWGESYAADYFGNDTVVVEEIVYCTHVSLAWVAPNSTIRANVRTFFHRRGTGAGDGVAQRALYPNCGQGSEAAVSATLGTLPRPFRVVQTSVLLRSNPPPERTN